MNRIPSLLLAIASLIAGFLIARVVHLGPSPGMYQIQPMSVGWVWRLDTTTGEIVLCKSDLLSNPVDCKNAEKPKTGYGKPETGLGFTPVPPTDGQEKR